MAGDNSKGGASNGKSHCSKRQQSNSHAKGHHNKNHHDKSDRPETGTMATEDLYGMESGATKKKKNKRRHRRPKPNPKLPTDFLALLCWDSWLPWPIDSKKTHIDKTSRKHKRSRKKTSHSGTSHRVQSWVREVSAQVTPSAPPIPPTMPSPAPSTPLLHPVSTSSGPQQGTQAEEAASNNGKNMDRGALTSCNANLGEKGEPKITVHATDQYMQWDSSETFGRRRSETQAGG
ncbi:hypothetical protein FPRO04_01860 [Fusarium proliferatum]|nr:hypothetical protein FPRO03_08605 [Fusarium proliferatum]KAG4274219.1 hypothetical protein FPRO04_01860 [Fusarium proliferatum]